MGVIRISRSDFIGNYKKLAAIVAPARVLPFIKDDAYGLGLDFAVGALLEAGAGIYCTARASDALRIKALVGPCQVWLCSVCGDAGVLKQVLDAGIIPTVGSADDLWALAGLETEIAFNLALDTGMGRFGLTSDDLKDFYEEYSKHENIQIVSTFTHFANCYGGKKCEKATRLQYDSFSAMVGALSQMGINCGILHAANSAAALLYPELRADAVRVGSALLGRCLGAKSAGLLPVGRLEAPVLTVKKLAKGHAVGYGSVFRARRDMTVAVIDCGHADGAFLSRRRDGFRLSDRLSAVKHIFSEKPLTCILNGQRVTVVGRVGLTSLVADVSGTECKPGDIAVFDFNPIFISAKEVAYEA